jgi:hypothetical protein
MPHEVDPGFNATERLAIALSAQGATQDQIAAVVGLSPSALESLFQGIIDKWPLNADPGSPRVDLPLDADTDHPHLDDMDAVGLLAHLRSMHGHGRPADATLRGLYDIHRSLHRAPPPSTA